MRKIYVCVFESWVVLSSIPAACVYTEFLIWFGMFGLVSMWGCGQEGGGHGWRGRRKQTAEGLRGKNEDEMTEGGAENSHVAVTCHQFNKSDHLRPKFIVKQSNGFQCFYCSKNLNSETLPLAKNADSAFISSGFKSWGNKEGTLERFTAHERSDRHETAMKSCLCSAAWSHGK